MLGKSQWFAVQKVAASDLHVESAVKGIAITRIKNTNIYEAIMVLAASQGAPTRELQ